MENNNNMNEIEQIHRQMGLLKRKLETQEIINEKLLVNSMKKKMSWIKKYFFFEVLIIIPIALLWYFIKMEMGLSWGCYLFLMAMVVIDVYCDYHINIRGMSDKDFQRCNMIETVKKLTSMKRQRVLQIIIQLPLCIAWIIWAGMEAMSVLDTSTVDGQRAFIQAGLVGGAIGTVIGIAVAYRIFKKMQNINSDVIRQINEMMTDEGEPATEE